MKSSINDDGMICAVAIEGECRRYPVPELLRDAPRLYPIYTYDLEKREVFGPNGWTRFKKRDLVVIAPPTVDYFRFDLAGLAEAIRRDRAPLLDYVRRWGSVFVRSLAGTGCQESMVSQALVDAAVVPGVADYLVALLGWRDRIRAALEERREGLPLRYQVAFWDACGNLKFSLEEMVTGPGFLDAWSLRLFNLFSDRPTALEEVVEIASLEAGRQLSLKEALNHLDTGLGDEMEGGITLWHWLQNTTVSHP